MKRAVPTKRCNAFAVRIGKNTIILYYIIYIYIYYPPVCVRICVRAIIYESTVY